MTPTPEELKEAIERLRGEVEDVDRLEVDGKGFRSFSKDLLTVCDAFMKADQERDQLRAQVAALRDALVDCYNNAPMDTTDAEQIEDCINNTSSVAAEHDAAVRKKALLDAATLLSLNANAECKDECVRCSQTRFLCKELRRFAEEKPV